MPTKTRPSSYNGHILREAREAAGVNLKDMASGIDYDTGNLSKVERGKLPVPEYLWTRYELELELAPRSLLVKDDALPEGLRERIAAWIAKFPKTGDHPSATSGKRCFLSVAAGLRNHLHVTLPERPDILTPSPAT